MSTIAAATGAEVVPFRDGSIGVYTADPDAFGAQPSAARSAPRIAQPIGYLHGMLGNPGRHAFLDALATATGRRVVAPCLPGFGPSPPRTDLRNLYDWVVTTSEIVDSVGLTGAPVVASSVGAMLALELAAVRPGVFDSIVAIAPLGLWEESEPVTDLFAVGSLDQPGLLLSDPDKATAFFKDDVRLGHEAAVELGISRYFSRRAAASLVWPIPDHGLRERIHLVTCPVVLVWGSADRLNPPGYAGRFAGALPGHAKTHTVDGAGHCVEWDEPDAVATIVARTLGG
jgi:pimeloyl-ACP methyl ester carboxylesterase